MKRTRTRFGSLILVLAMLLTLLPVSAFAADEPVAQVGNQTYATLADAFQDANGKTVKLLKNVYLDSTIEIPAGKTITFDLNGNNITVYKDESTGRSLYAINNYGEFTLLDSVGGGTITARGIQNLDSGVMTIDSGKIISCDSNGGAAIWNEATVTINGGTFETVYVGSASDNVGIGCLNNSGTALITAGTFNDVNKRTYAVISTGKIEITPADGKEVVVTGAHGGLAVDSGTAIVNGGSYSSTDFYGLYVSNDGMGADPMTAAVTVNGGTYTGKQFAVWIGSDYNDPVNSTIAIYGGIFNKPLNAQDNARKGAIVIFGGTFSSDPSAYVADGMKVTGGSSESFGVALNTDAFAAGTGTEADPYVIKTEAQLRAFAADVNAGHSYAGKYIQLGDNVTLTKEWTPIGNGARNGSAYTGNAFKGTFDGNGKTISGLKITTGSGDNAIGLFGVVAGGTVKDLTLADISINVSDNELAGGVAGLLCDNGLISGCTVSGVISIKDGAGGIVGRMVISGTVSGCTNNASVTCSAGGAAGIVGKAYYTQPDKTMTIENCINNGAITNPGYHAGGISALCAANVTSCTNNGLITAGNTAGGIVAEQVNWGTVSGCTNTAEIKGDNNAGGIIGWVRYQTDTTSYAKSDTISVLNNTNNAVITTKTENKSAGGLGWGGIVGTVYNAALVSGNENTASSITGGTFGAGIVGNLQENKDNLYYTNFDINVVNNISTTPLESITVDGPCKSEYAYNNSANSFMVEENSTQWVAQIGEQKYATLTAALAAAKTSNTIKLLENLESAAAIIIPAGVTLDGGNKTLTYTGGSKDAPSNGAFITAGGENVTIQNLTIETNNQIKHGVQFYSVKSGKVSSVTINGGAYTSVIVNNSQNIILENCILNSNGYANIEYAIGSNISNMVIPSLTVDNVTFKPAGENGKPFMIWADQATVGRIVTVLGGQAAEADAVAKIKENLTNKNPDDVVISVGLSSGTVNEPVSGVGYPSGSTSYAITVDKADNGTVTSSRTRANKGLTITLTVKADEGYALDTLTVIDKNGNEIKLTDKGDGKYTFTMPASAVTVKASFVKDDTPVDTGLPFTDVKADDWFCEAVKYVYDNKLMDGTSSTTFAPLMTTNRAMIVTILWRLEGQPQTEAAPSFTDVESGVWYTEAVAWAADQGIVKGYSDTVFAPDDTVTREQLATILYRYAQYKGYDVAAKGDLTTFTDGAKTSSWAAEAMEWAVGSGLLTGKDGGKLDPTGTATRAEVATILMRFVESVSK